nr:MAG TPA: cold shock protein [Caudoviricetes sp.]
MAVGDEFEVVEVHGYGFIVETDDGPLFIRRSECEVLGVEL